MCFGQVWVPSSCPRVNRKRVESWRACISQENQSPNSTANSKAYTRDWPSEHSLQLLKEMLRPAIL